MIDINGKNFNSENYFSAKKINYIAWSYFVLAKIAQNAPSSLIGVNFICIFSSTMSFVSGKHAKLLGSI